MTPLDPTDVKDLYRELILDHAKSPRNFGRLDNATHSATGINPLCGDKLHLYVSVNADGKLMRASFEGSGCAISIASASLLTEVISQLPLDAAERAISDVTTRLSTPDIAVGNDDAVDWTKLRALEGVRQHPSRIKCATLAWQTLRSALTASPTPASTE